MSKSVRTSRRQTGVNPKDFDFSMFVYSNEGNYKYWFGKKWMVNWFQGLHDNTAWNCIVCAMALGAIIIMIPNVKGTYVTIIDVVYNVVYGVHVLAILYYDFFKQNRVEKIWCKLLGYLIDLCSYAHYPVEFLMGFKDAGAIKADCYAIRLHRPARYLWALNDYNLKNSVLGTALKYCYIFLVLRVLASLVWVDVETVMEESVDLTTVTRKVMHMLDEVPSETDVFDDSQISNFIRTAYIINKMFIPIGPVVAPSNDYERMTCVLLMMTGCLVVTGAAVASLSLVISIYMRPEEEFRARYRLIRKEMEDACLPPELRYKVDTFYKMYWHKQKAVSVTNLLSRFPPSLPTLIYTDIYFEAQQKSRILRDLSYQFLSEVAKTMETIHYIPGDSIIDRSSVKSSIIYIACGDVEMLTAEDDMTPILRMTRGTILSPCSGDPAAACGRAHVTIRAATFCTAHVLKAADLWRVATKYGVDSGQAYIMTSAFNEHFEKVKRHYAYRKDEYVCYKSSILHFKRNLLGLKEALDADGQMLLMRNDVFLEIAGCYIMRNRLDSSLTDESDAICLSPTFPCILQPSSSLLVAWHSFVTIIICAVCIFHPYHLVYLSTPSLEFRFFDYVVSAVFVLDIIVHLSTGANVEEGVPITFAQTSSQQMCSHWFVLDVLGTLPIFEFIGNGHYVGINKLLRLHKVFRVLKSMEDVCVYHSNVLRFGSYGLLFVFSCYLVATLQQGFVCQQFGYCQVTNFTHPPHWQEQPLDSESWPVENRLLFGLYWAISMITFTSHKTQTWGVESFHNIIFTMVVLEICIILSIFVGAMYSATIMVTTAMRDDYESCIENVKNFLIKNDMDPMLRLRFIKYLELCWYTDKAYSMTHMKDSIFYDLPPKVYQDIVAKQRSKYILCIPFMKYLSKEDFKIVSSRARLFYTSPNEILLNTGDISNELYVIKQGTCEILNPDTKTVIGTLTTKNPFGVLECMLRLPAFYTIRAVTHVQVFSISRKYLLTAITMPRIKDAIDFAKEQPEYFMLQIRRKSFVTFELPPPAPNREFFHLPRKHEPDIAFLYPFNRLGFLSVLRYIFPRYSIRPDGNYMTRYEWFRAVCAFSSAMVFPSYTYLELQWPGLYFFTSLLDFTAYYDLVQRMLVGYYNKDGILVYHPSSTAAHYLKGAFFIDLCACLPLENLEAVRKEIHGNNFYHRVTSTTQFLMLNRLLQLYRLPPALDILRAHMERRDIILVIKAIPLFMALLNVVTCMMVYSSADIYQPISPESQQVGWLIEPSSDAGGSWLQLFDREFRFNMIETPWNLHLATYFWVVYETTSTGYNNFSPSNLNIVFVLFCGMVVGAMMTTYFSVLVISIRANVNKALATYQERIKDMATYMKREKLNKNLQREVLDYLEHNWDKMGGTDYRNILKLCHQITLRTDVILHIYGHMFATCPVLHRCDASLLRIVGRAVRSVYFLEGTVIIEKDDVIADMYFIGYGLVDVKGDGYGSDTTLPRGSVFGNMESSVETRHTVRCPTIMVAGSNVHLLAINTCTFMKIIADFPAVRVLMKKYRKQNESYIVGGSLESLSSVGMSKVHRSSIFAITGRRSLVMMFYTRKKLCDFYLITISLLCVYTDVYNAGFQDNSTWLILSLYALDVAFYLKVLMIYMLPSLVTGSEAKKACMNSKKAYCSGEFKYDIISIIPIELLCLVKRDMKWKLFPLLRLNRMFRTVTVYNCLKRHQEKLSANLVLSTIFSVLIWFTLFMHCSTSLWYFIGVVEESRNPHSSWLYNATGQPSCDNLYICSLYFVLTTFTQYGVGDILPKKQSEVIFVVILQILSTMVYMVYVGEFSNTIQFQSFRCFDFYSKYLELQEFLKNNRVSKNIVKNVNEYSLHLWRESRGVQIPYFLQNAPACLKLKIMSAAYQHHLTKNPAFKDCEPAFLRQLVGHLQLYTYNEGMYVVKENEITDSMYLIHKGRVQEIAEDIENKVQVYNAGQHFGLLQGVRRNTPFVYSYRTITKSQVHTLRLDDWYYLLKHFPNSKNAIYKNVPDSDVPPDDDDMGPPEDIETYVFEDKSYSDKRRQTSIPPETKETDDHSGPSNGPPELQKPESSKKIKRFRFVPPPGPTPLDKAQAPNLLEPGLWPMNNRRSFTVQPRNIEEDEESEERNSTRHTMAEEGETLDRAKSLNTLLPAETETEEDLRREKSVGTLLHTKTEMHSLRRSVTATDIFGQMSSDTLKPAELGTDEDLRRTSTDTLVSVELRRDVSPKSILYHKHDDQKPGPSGLSQLTEEHSEDFKPRTKPSMSFVQKVKNIVGKQSQTRETYRKTSIDDKDLRNLSKKDMRLLKDEYKDALLLEQDIKTTAGLLEQFEEENNRANAIGKTSSTSKSERSNDKFKGSKLKFSVDFRDTERASTSTITDDTDSLKIEGAEAMDVEEYLTQKHKESKTKRITLFRKKEDEAVNKKSSLSRLSRRFTRVRYSEHDLRSLASEGSIQTWQDFRHAPTAQQSSINLRTLSDDARPVSELSPSERNLRTLDSDVVPESISTSERVPSISTDSPITSGKNPKDKDEKTKETDKKKQEIDIKKGETDKREREK